jgi:hypothetical protein
MKKSAIAALLVACSSASVAPGSAGSSGTSGTSSQGIAFKDATGRACTRASTSSKTATCDRPPEPTGGCKEGATACYNVESDPDIDGGAVVSPIKVRNCAGCCTDQGAGHGFQGQTDDCALVSCTKDDDCAGESHVTCTNGVCLGS